MPTGSPVSTDRIGDVVVLTLQNPPVNTLAQPVRAALYRELEAADLDGSVVAVVIAGGKQFSAGADLAEFDSGRALAHPTLHGELAGLLDSLRVPSVAAITGVALGGGLELALACDMRVASDNAQLGLPEVTLANLPGFGGTQRLPRLIGAAHAMEITLSGTRIAAQRAFQIGLVNAVHPQEELPRQVLTLAATIASRSLESLTAIKQVIRAGLEGSLAAGLEAEARAVARLWGSPAQKAAQSAFFSTKRERAAS